MDMYPRDKIHPTHGILLSNRETSVKSMMRITRAMPENIAATLIGDEMLPEELTDGVAEGWCRWLPS
jgi:hypothetical protein